jgi:mannitol/fructose-specific phosphotransferase system IIA component
MRGTGIEKEVEICATNITNKTKCMSTTAKKLKKIVLWNNNTAAQIRIQIRISYDEEISVMRNLLTMFCEEDRQKRADIRTTFRGM